MKKSYHDRSATFHFSNGIFHCLQSFDHFWLFQANFSLFFLKKSYFLILFFCLYLALNAFWYIHCLPKKYIWILDLKYFWSILTQIFRGKLEIKSYDNCSAAFHFLNGIFHCVKPNGVEIVEKTMGNNDNLLRFRVALQKLETMSGIGIGEISHIQFAFGFIGVV